MSDVEPDWSREHISRGNKFTLQLALAWLALVVLSAMFARTGVVGFAFVGLAALFLTWMLVHALFEHVDELVKTRLSEAGVVGADDGGDDGTDRGADTGTSHDIDDGAGGHADDSTDDSGTDGDAKGPN